MIPTVQEQGSGFQGSGLTNSFATNATNNKYLEIEGLVYLFNHELQHNWTGHIIKNDDGSVTSFGNSQVTFFIIEISSPTALRLRALNVMPVAVSSSKLYGSGSSNFLI